LPAVDASKGRTPVLVLWFDGFIGDFRVVAGVSVWIRPVRTGRCPYLLYMVCSRGRGSGWCWLRHGVVLSGLATSVRVGHGSECALACVSYIVNALKRQKAATFVAQGVRTSCGRGAPRRAGMTRSAPFASPGRPRPGEMACAKDRLRRCPCGTGPYLQRPDPDLAHPDPVAGGTAPTKRG
jgi:hypothetical protein